MIRQVVWGRWLCAPLPLALLVVFIAYQWSAAYSFDIGDIKADDEIYTFSALPVLGLALPTGARWSLAYLALTTILLANMCLHDGALLDMFGLLQHKQLPQPIKLLYALTTWAYWPIEPIPRSRVDAGNGEALLEPFKKRRWHTRMHLSFPHSPRGCQTRQTEGA